MLVWAQAASEAISLKRDNKELLVRPIKWAKFGPAVECTAQMIYLAMDIKQYLAKIYLKKRVRYKSSLSLYRKFYRCSFLNSKLQALRI